MEAICSSETSIDFQRTTRCYIPEDITLHNHWCDNLKPNILTDWECWMIRWLVDNELERRDCGSYYLTKISYINLNNWVDFIVLDNLEAASYRLKEVSWVDIISTPVD
jgi:hypothetical protein